MDGTPQPTLLDYYHSFCNLELPGDVRVGKPPTSDLKRRQDTWLEAHLRRDLPGGLTEAKQVFITFVHTMYWPFVQNTVALSQGSVWIEPTSRVLILQLVKKSQEIQDEHNKISGGKLLRYLMENTDEILVESSNSDQHTTSDKSPRSSTSAINNTAPPVDITIIDINTQIATAQSREETEPGEHVTDYALEAQTYMVDQCIHLASF